MTIEELRNLYGLSKTKQRERPMRCVIYTFSKGIDTYRGQTLRDYYILTSAWGFQRCSFRQSGQCEGLSIVERATGLAPRFFVYIHPTNIMDTSVRSRQMQKRMDMKLNEQLESLYASQWKEFCDACRALSCNGHTSVKPSYPFLLSLAYWDNGVPTESWYTDADLKVMIFGQETNSWVGTEDDFGTPPSPVFNPEVTMGAVMGIYENFYSDYHLNHREGFNFNATRYGTFHNGFNRFASMLNARCAGKRIAYLWNNIVKIGKAEGSGFCGEEIYRLQKQHFDVVGKEVEILKPDLILFLTGSYDSRICDCWAGAQFTALPPFAVGDVAKVMLPGVDVPAYRTNHPSARLSKEEKEKRLEAIVSDFMEVELK